MTSAEFSVTVEGESLLVKVAGELDLATAPELDACLRPVRGDVAIDCSGLDFIDSSGIRSLVEAHRAAEARGDEIVGVWHSHTHSDPYPSPTDVRSAVDPMWWYVIVSLRDEAPMLRAYRIVEGSIAESRVELDGG